MTLQEAEAISSQVDYLLMRIEQKFLAVPTGADIVAFVRSGGQVKEPEDLVERTEITLGQLRDRYLATHENGSLEKSSLDGIRLHFKHLVETLGELHPIRSLSLTDLQRHVDRRSESQPGLILGPQFDGLLRGHTAQLGHPSGRPGRLLHSCCSAAVAALGFFGRGTWSANPSPVSHSQPVCGQTDTPQRSRT